MLPTAACRHTVTGWFSGRIYKQADKQIYRYTGIQIYTYTGIQVYRYTYIQIRVI